MNLTSQTSELLNYEVYNKRFYGLMQHENQYFLIYSTNIISNIEIKYGYDTAYSRQEIPLINFAYLVTNIHSKTNENLTFFKVRDIEEYETIVKILKEVIK